MIDVAALNVGDKIGVHYSGGWHGETRIETVERKTATQVIVGGARFNKHGHKVGQRDSYHWTTLIPVAEAEERMKAQAIRAETNRIANSLREYNWRDMPLEKLREIAALLPKAKP